MRRSLTTPTHSGQSPTIGSLVDAMADGSRTSPTDAAARTMEASATRLEGCWDVWDATAVTSEILSPPDAAAGVLRAARFAVRRRDTIRTGSTPSPERSSDAPMVDILALKCWRGREILPIYSDADLTAVQSRRLELPRF